MARGAFSVRGAGLTFGRDDHAPNLAAGEWRDGAPIPNVIPSNNVGKHAAARPQLRSGNDVVTRVNVTP